MLRECYPPVIWGKKNSACFIKPLQIFLFFYSKHHVCLELQANITKSSKHAAFTQRTLHCSSIWTFFLWFKMPPMHFYVLWPDCTEENFLLYQSHTGLCCKKALEGNRTRGRFRSIVLCFQSWGSNRGLVSKLQWVLFQCINSTCRRQTTKIMKALLTDHISEAICTKGCTETWSSNSNDWYVLCFSSFSALQNYS